MSLATLFYMKETFRESVRRWRQACFRQRVACHSTIPHSTLSKSASRFLLEALEPRLLLSATPIEILTPQELTTSAVTVPAGSLPSLDVDLNGQADALSDGIVIIRHLFEFIGNDLTDGAVDPTGQRTDPTAIATYLESIRSSLDVDLNQKADALSDGITIIRSLFGFIGNELTDGAIDLGGGRTDPAAIATFLDNMNPQRELIAPLVTAGLQQDTGVSATDAITFNPTITGTIADINQIASFTAGFDATTLANYTDILSDLLPNGTFGLSTVRLGQIFGSPLADGTHTLHLRVTDARGNLTTLDQTLTLDTAAPITPTFNLAVTSDTGTVGDQETSVGVVTLKGQTDPTTSVQLVGPGIRTLSTGTGTFQLPDLALALGANPFTFRASDVAGNESDFSRTITRLAATQQADVVLTWNQVLLEAIRLDATPPPMASRGMAMVSLAMYDTINAIEGTPGYYVSLSAQPGSSADAAVASAAHRVLSYLYPGQQAFFDTQLAASLALVPNGVGKTDGIALGQNIAGAIIAIRATDGWNDFIDYVPGNQPGDWQPTAPMFDVALLPQWADLTPFALTSPDQFTPAGPPALDSAVYAAAFNEVKALGSATGSTRTADQTEIARFWADGSGTYTPPGHWNQIASQIALEQGNSLSANARLFAQLNVALADAGITAWDAKYQYEFWRPITAIHQADLDGNAATTKDATWTSFLITPPFPEYTSGHSTFSGAAAEILSTIFGPTRAFTITSLGLPGVSRSFTSFEQAAQEAGKSRIYGGIHFEFSNQDGLTAGKALADFVLNRFTVTTDTQGPTILLNQQSGTVTKTNLTLTGQVLDNLSGVAALQAKLDNGAFAPVTVSPTGTFSLPTTLALDGTGDGLHTVTFQATDLQNNLSTLLFTFTLDTIAPTITLTNPLDNATLTVDSRLSGIADATGSKLVELCYKFDDGTLMPVSFDPTTGSFDAALDLSKLAVGTHTLSLRAQDQAGNVTTVIRNVTLAAPIPLTIIEVTPQSGASDVGSTFRPQVFFSRPINAATLSNNNFYATDTTGQKLAATIVPSQDGTFAWLFFTIPMPGASTITLHVDGTTILAAGDGQALDADANGTPGGVFTSTFSTVSLVPLVGTTLSGTVLDPGPDLKTMTFDDVRAGADGVLHTSDDVYLNPIAGVKVFIVGLENQAVFTDVQGNFSFSAVPSGNIKLAVDGRTATNAPTGFYFPEMVMDLQIEVGQANTVMGTMGTREAKAANFTRPEVYLPRLQTSILQTVSDTQTTLVGVNATAAPNLTDQQRQFLTLEVQPGSLIGPDGQPITDGQIGISTVPPELVRDMLPPGLLQHTFDITIQAPDAATFSTPLQMTFPNVFNAAPGTKLNFLSFDHTTGRLVIEGTATVSADGLSVTTDPDSGITKPGWHGLTPPSSNDEVDPDPEAEPEPNDDLEYLFKVQFGANFSFNPIELDYSAGISLPDIFEEVSGLNLNWNGEFKFPDQPQPIPLSFENTFTVPKLFQSLVPTGTFTLGTLKVRATVSAGLGLEGTVDITGFEVPPEAELQDMRIRPGNIELQFGIQFTDSWLCSLPFDIGEWICMERSPDPITLFGPPSIELPDLDIPLPFKAVLDYMDEFSIGLFASVGTSFSISPTVSITKTLVPAIQTLQSLPFDAPELQLVQNALQLTSSPNLSTLASVAPNADIYYRYDIANGISFQGHVNRGESVHQVLPPNSEYTLYIYDPSTNRSFTETGTTGLSGSTSKRAAPLTRIGGFDIDADGIPDIGEYVIGTSLTTSDTDNDGLTDLAELRQGLDPLGGKAFSTGVIAALAIRGEAKEVVLEGSILNAEQQIAYVATGSYGLAVVDAAQFQKPTILSQLDLPGDATDVSVDSSLAIAVVASNAGGLHFIDISNPTVPTLTRTIATTPNQVEVFDGFAYVTVGSALRSYNLLTGELVQSVAVSTGSLVGLAREGNVLYTTDSANVLRATSLGVGVLTPRGSLTIPLGFGDTAGKIFVGNGIAYIGAEGAFNGGFVTADVLNADAITLLSGVDGAGIAGKRIVANGSGLGVTVGKPGGVFGTSVLDVVSLTDPTNTNNFLTRFTLPAEPFSDAIGAGIAFVADGTGGLQVVNYRAFDNQGLAPVVSITSPVIDVDPVTPGIQVTEGAGIPVRVSATDDVQVRNVELLVNDIVVSNDVSFPFELSAIALGSTPSATTTTVQVRATDTGGNATLSNVLTFNLVPDTFAPILASDNISGGLLHDQTFKVIQLQFSEALDANTVTAQNFQLLGPNGLAVAPTVVQLIRGGTLVQLGYSLFDVGTNQLVIKSSAVTDRAGNALGTQDLIIPFEIVSHLVPPLNPLPPLGSQMYVQGVAGQIDTPATSESFTISLDAGQIITMGLSPDSAALRLRIELLDGTGAVLGLAESSEIGVGVTLQAVRVSTTGVYTLRVQSLSGTGSFNGAVYLNALEETEFFGGPTNDTLATATELSPTSLPLQGTADRMAVIGAASGGNDFYRVDLTQGQGLEAMLQAFGGGNIGLDLRDSAGTVLTLGQSDLSTDISQAIFDFVAPATGAYYLNVTGLSGPDFFTGIPLYSLVVTRNAAFEAFPNDTLATPEDMGLTGQIIGSVGSRVFPQIGLPISDPADFYSFFATAGDVLTITTATPGDGIGEPANTLDPALQLYGLNDPIGPLSVYNDNGGADGRNAVISWAITETGPYTIAVLPTTGAGDYSVRVTGATGTVTPTSTVVSSFLTTQGTEASLTLEFSSPILLSTVQPGDVTINGVVASTVSTLDATTLRFTVNGVTEGGEYTAVLGAGAVQDIRGTPNEAFSLTFIGDTTAPVVIASSISPLALVPPSDPLNFQLLVVTVTLSEELDQTVLDIGDMRLDIGDDDTNKFNFFITASSFAYSPLTDQLQIEFPVFLADDTRYALHLVSSPGGIRDLAGNPLDGSPSFPLPSGQIDSRTDDYVLEFGVGTSTPSFEPLDHEEPPGSLMFFSRDITSVFGAVSEKDTWTVALDAGQVLAVGLFPSSAIQGRLEVFDPNGVKIGSVTGSGIGKTSALVDLSVPIAGTYRFEVTSLAGVGPYRVGFALNASVDVEDPVLLAGHNNTIATAQSIQGSAIPLQGSASRVATFGEWASSVDADVYSFQLTAGQATTFVLDQGFTSSGPFPVGRQIELLDQAASLITTRTLQRDGSVRIENFIPQQTGTYFARVSAGSNSTDYNFLVLRGATLEAPLLDATAQNISQATQVVGEISKAPSGIGGGIRVAVLGVDGATELVNQLNDDTFFNFDAVVVTQAEIDTVVELSDFDVVVIGDPGSRGQLEGEVEQALQNWWFRTGGGLVGTGGLITAAGSTTGFTLFGLDFIMPIDINGGAIQVVADQSLTIASPSHEVSQGLVNFAIPGPAEVPSGDVNDTGGFAPVEVLATVVGRPAVTVMTNSFSHSRSAYVAPSYYDVTATGLRSGSADRLLEQAVAWASGIDFFDSYSVQGNVGDQLVIKTTTPFDGPNLPQNLLDPRLELLNPAGTVVASNDNGAADGKNALINYTVPVGAGGEYTVRVHGSQTGEYTLAVTGATGVASASADAIVTLADEVSLSSASTPSSSFDGSLAFVQRSWVKDFVAPTAAGGLEEDEELLIQLA